VRLRLNQVVFGLGRGVLGASANRMGIWTQGCSLRKCPGCTSTHTWSPDDGTAVSVESVLHLARMQKQPPTGVTVSGGEPTDQAEGVAAFVVGFREAFAGAEIVFYTGLRWPVLAQRST
jgi:anaerobic ribonucleoside-triphosphate reductase activating protein